MGFITEYILNSLKKHLKILKNFGFIYFLFVFHVFQVFKVSSFKFHIINNF